MNDGEKVTLEELEAEGYSVEFQSTSQVFDGNSYTSETGLLKKNLSIGSFEYKVVITKDGQEPVESELVEVKVLNANEVVTPTEVALVANNNVWELDYLTVGESANIVVTKGTNFAGKEIDANKDANAHVQESLASTPTYTSSNPTVALVSSKGEINPLKAGNTTITVKVGDNEISYDLEVKEAQKLDKVKETSFKVSDTTTELTLTLLDQYGEKLRTDALVSSDINVYAKSGKNTVVKSASVSDGIATVVSGLDTNNEVLTITNLKLAEGTETLVVKQGDKVLGEVTLEVVDITSAKVDDYKIVAPQGKDFKLDIYGSEDKTVDLKVEKYVDGVLAGTDESAPTGFTFVSSNTNVAEVDATTGVVTAKAEGTTTISYKQGGITVATATITVVNSTPQITKLTLTEEAGDDIELTVSEGLTEFLEQLDFTFANKDTAIEVTAANADKVIASIVDSEGVLSYSEDVSNTLTVTSNGDVNGTVVVTIEDAFGGGEYVFDLKVTGDNVPPTLALTNNSATAPVITASEKLYYKDGNGELVALSGGTLDSDAAKALFNVSGSAKLNRVVLDATNNTWTFDVSEAEKGDTITYNDEQLYDAAGNPLDGDTVKATFNGTVWTLEVTSAQ